MVINKKENVQILTTFSKEKVKQIEKYWHKKQLKNRSDAIRELVDLGLESESRRSE